MAEMKITSKLDTRNYERGIKKMQSDNSKFGGGLDSIKSKIKAAFAVGAIVVITKKIYEAIKALTLYASELKTLSDQAGVNVEKFQFLGRAAVAVGEDMDTVRDALGALRTAQGEVLNGDKEMLKQFEALGISLNDIANMGVDELFVEIGKAVNQAGFSAKEFAALSKIIGEGDALKLKQSFEEAGKGFEQIDKDFVQVSERSAVALDRMKNGFVKLGQTIKNAFTNALGSTVAFFQSEEKIREKMRKSQESVDLQKKANLEQYNDLQRKAAEEKQKELDKEAKKRQEIRAKQAEEIGKIERSVKLEIETDSFRKIGGFAGAQISEQLKYARQQAEISRKLAEYQKNLPAIEKNTRNIGGLT